MEFAIASGIGVLVAGGIYLLLRARTFDVILGLAGNPPKGSMDILSTRIYTTFANSQYGYAAAEAILFVIVIVVLNFAVRKAVGFTQAQA